MPFVTRVHRNQVRITAGRISSRKLARILRDLEQDAKVFATGGPYSTGRLARSISTTGPIPIGWHVEGTVYSPLSYAGIVEKGASVHEIFPKGSSHMYRFKGSPFYEDPPQLKFRWRGRIVFTPQVPMAPWTIGLSHPGMRGKHFLLRACGKAATKYRMRLIVYSL